MLAKAYIKYTFKGLSQDYMLVWLYFVFAVINTMTKSNPRRKGFTSPYNLQLIVKGRQCRNWAAHERIHGAMRKEAKNV